MMVAGMALIVYDQFQDQWLIFLYTSRVIGSIPLK